MKHTNNVTTPKYHAHATVVFITMVKIFTIKSIHIQMMLDTEFHLFHCSHHHSPDTILCFLHIFVMQEKEAHQLHCHSSILLLVQNFIGYIVLVIIPQTQPFAFFKFLQYKNKHIVSNTVIVRLWFLYTLMQFNQTILNQYGGD